MTPHVFIVLYVLCVLLGAGTTFAVPLDSAGQKIWDGISADVNKVADSECESDLKNALTDAENTLTQYGLSSQFIQGLDDLNTAAGDIDQTTQLRSDLSSARSQFISALTGASSLNSAASDSTITPPSPSTSNSHKTSTSTMVILSSIAFALFLS